jgi:hypothetical protein
MSRIARKLARRKRRIIKRLERSQRTKYRQLADDGIQNVLARAGENSLPDREQVAPRDLPRALLESAPAHLLPVMHRAAEFLHASALKWCAPAGLAPKARSATNHVSRRPTTSVNNEVPLFRDRHTDCLKIAICLPSRPTTHPWDGEV